MVDTDKADMDGKRGLHNKRGSGDAVLPAGDADEPGAGIRLIQLAENVLNFKERRCAHLSGNLLNQSRA